MQYIFRSRSSTSAVAASKSVSATISLSGCLLPVVGERGNGLRRTSEQKSVSATVTEKNCTSKTSATARSNGFWSGSSGRRPMGTRTEQSAFKQRLGEFYVRFYSAMSEAAQSQDYDKSRGKNKDNNSHRNEQRDLPTITYNPPLKHSFQRRSISRSTHLNNGATPAAMGALEGQYRGDDRLNGDLSKTKQRFQPHTSHCSDPSPPSLVSMHDPTAAARSQQRPSKKRVPRPQKRVTGARYLDTSKIEEAAVSITSELIENQTLGHEILKFHNQKLRKLARERGDWASKAAQRQDIEMLRNTLKYINSNPVAETAEAVAFIAGKGKDGKQETDNKYRQYVPPFPRYTSTEAPIALNNALQSLLTRRPVLHSVIPKVCYNLLTSNSAPDIKTYNILLRNLVLLRKNALVELVFQEMISAGEAPDEYTVVALLELMVKSGDFKGWKSIVRLQHKEEKGSLKSKDRVRSKFLMESLIIHAARFGKRELVRRYTRALKNYWPEDPEPGKNVLVALLRFYSEKKEFNNGKYAWHKLLDMDQKRTPSTREEVLDERAWYWWLKHCNSCGMEKQFNKWASIAQERGVDIVGLLAKGPNKVRGLHVRANIKNPMWIQYDPAGDWWEEQREEKRKKSYSQSTPEPPITEEEKRKIVGDIFYDRLYGPSSGDSGSQNHNLKIPAPRLVQTSKKIIASNQKQDLHIETKEEEKKRKEACDLTGHEKSLIWENVVVTRMDMLLRRHKAQEIKEHKGEIMITAEERKRGQILTKWKEGIGGEGDAGKTEKRGVLPARGRRVYHRPTYERYRWGKANEGAKRSKKHGGFSRRRRIVGDK